MFDKIGMNPWLKIWVEPRKTIQAIVDYNPKYQFPLLSAIYGFPLMLHIMQNISAGMNLGLWAIILISLVLCVIAGMIGITIGSWLLLWTGKWIGGKADFQEMRCAVAWSNVPNIVNILMWIILIYTFKTRLFVETFAEGVFVGKEMGIVSFVFFIQSVIGIWSFIIMLHTVGQVQKFSAWKALLNVIIPFLIVVIALWVLLLIFTPMTVGNQIK